MSHEPRAPNLRVRVVRFYGAETPRDLEQGWIELDERPFHGRVLGVAVDAAGHGVAGQRRDAGIGRSRLTEREERPPVRETRVLHFGFDSRHCGLELSRTIRRGFFGGLPKLKDEDRLVWPLAGLHERAVRGWVDEHVVESLGPRRSTGGRIIQVEARAEKHPFTIVSRANQVGPVLVPRAVA